MRSPDQSLKLGLAVIIRVELAREPEVNDLELRMVVERGEHDVLQLQVSMGNANVMQVLNGVKQFSNNFLVLQLGIEIALQ